MPILLILTVIPPTSWTFWLLSMQKWIQDHWIDGQRHKKFENWFRNGHITVIYSFRVAQEAQNHPKLGLYRFETLLDPKSLTFSTVFWQKSIQDHQIDGKRHKNFENRLKIGHFRGLSRSKVTWDIQNKVLTLLWCP